MEKLIVRNFGAIRDVEIELKALTIFIGESGTGKSTLAKLISIFRGRDFWADKNIREVSFFKECLTYYQINNFLEQDSYIEYHSKIGISFLYQQGQILQSFSEELVQDLESQLKDLVQGEDWVNRIEEITTNSFNYVIYMPADRGAVSFLAEKFAAIKKEKLIGVFPETLTDFTGDFNRISSILKRHYIKLFDVTYQKSDGKDYIELPNGKSYLLSEAASGMQTAIPVILVLEYFSQSREKKSYTIEEPELNLFPTAQKALVEFFAEKVLGCGHELVITTHSPYILTSLNNLIFAHQVGQTASQVNEVISHRFWVNSQDVVSYFVKDGTTSFIIDNELQQIRADEIDGVSNIINATYDKVLEIQVDGEDE